MTKTEKIISILEKMGYCPEVDEDGDIYFSYQMKTIYVMVGEEEDPYISVMLPKFHQIEDDTDIQVLAVCDKMTREMKLAKVFIEPSYSSVTSTCEFYYANDEALEQCLRKSLQILGIIRAVFRKDLAELSD